MEINEALLCADYGNTRNFCEKMQITQNVYNALKAKKTNSFRGNESDSFKAMTLMRKLGYITIQGETK